LRGGAAPEVSAVTFELSTNGGGSWTPLGTASRISGGWELTGLSLNGSGQIRARGRTSGGFSNGSSGLTETIVPFSFAPENPRLPISFRYWLNTPRSRILSATPANGFHGHRGNTG